MSNKLQVLEVVIADLLKLHLQQDYNLNKKETPTKETIEMLWQIKGYFKEVKGNYDEYTQCIQTTIDKLKELKQ